MSMGPLSLQHGLPRVWIDGPQLWRVAVNIIKSRCEKMTRGGSPAGGLGTGLTSPTHKDKLDMKQFTEPWTWMASLEKRTEQWNMDMIFRT
jgi:hypothetical protein